MPRPFAAFMSSGPHARFAGAAGGVMIAVALAAVLPARGAEPAPSSVQSVLGSESVRAMGRTFRMRPGEMFVRFSDAGAKTSAAESLGVLLEAQAAAGEDQQEEIALLLENAVRGAFARGLDLAKVADVLTTVDPKGELLPAPTRDALWRELAGRPSGSRVRPRALSPAPNMGPPPATVPSRRSAHDGRDA